MSVIGHCFRITSGNENNGVSKKPSGFPLQAVVDRRLISAYNLQTSSMMTHMYVDTTVKAAADNGYQVKLIADACVTMDLELNGEIIPAETIQKVFAATLDGVVATIV